MKAKLDVPCGVLGCDCGCAIGKRCDCGTKAKEESYSEAQARANRGKLPLVVFVGKQLRDVAGAVTVALAVSVLADYPDRCIIVSDREGYWKATLPADATDKQIADAVKGVSQSASPFDKSNRRRG